MHARACIPAGSLRAGLILIALSLTSCEAPPAVQATAVETPAAQQTSPDDCVPIAAIRAIARSQGTPVAMVRPVAAFLTAFNAIPPASDVTADEIDVARLGDMARLLFVTAGCVTRMGQIPWEEFLRLAGEGT